MSSEVRGTQFVWLAREFSLFSTTCKRLEILAERGGFEPPVDFKGLRRFSKPLLSTTQPPLRAPAAGLKRMVAQAVTSSQKLRCAGFSAPDRAWKPAGNR